MAIAPATADTERPIEIDLIAAGDASDSGQQRGTLRTEALGGGNPAVAGRIVAMATSYDGANPDREAERSAIGALIAGVAGGNESVVADALRSGFREANRQISLAAGEHDPDAGAGVAMLALVTKGKYASIGLVGEDRVYLLRAGRLTQLTRDQRVERARSRRKRDLEQQRTQSGTQAPVRLLGEAERLDNRSPAIFEITLLPEDRLAVLSRGVIEAMPEDRILETLALDSSEAARQLTATPRSGDSPLMVAIVTVAPAREVSPILKAHLETRSAQPRPLWPILVGILALVVLVAVAAYFLL
jgi:PPM family protein phosphatase